MRALPKSWKKHSQTLAMVSMHKPPIDLSIAVRKHHDPAVESQVCVICPRRKGKPQERSSGTSPVALSLEFLRPLFKKPLTQVSEELGLSATAIKKACRRFGVPKWPFRTLTSKTSRNRTTLDSVPVSLPTAAHGATALGSLDGARQNPPVLTDDLKKLKEDAEMIKEVAALAAKAASEEKKDGAVDSELAAVSNLSLLSATAIPADGKVDLGELQMQYIRALQQQQQQASMVKVAPFAPQSDGSDIAVAVSGALPSLPSNLILPSPNPVLGYPGLGGQVLCPVPMRAFNLAMPGQLQGLPFPMMVPALVPSSYPLSS